MNSIELQQQQQFSITTESEKVMGQLTQGVSFNLPLLPGR